MPSSIAARPEGRGTKNRGSLHDRPKVVEFRAKASYSRADHTICKRMRPGLALHETQVLRDARRTAHRNDRRRDHIRDACGVRVN